MKLFKSLLVAPAALGLLAPMAATANEVTVNDFNPSIENTLLAGGEGLVTGSNSSYDGSFSETTAASFSADFAIGAVDGASNEKVTTGFGYQIDLSTSFTGEDSFDVSIDAGNAANGTLGELDLNDSSGSGTSLFIDGISYTFPLGDKMTVFVGDSVDGSLLYSTACVYGGVTNTLDDCGNASSAMDGGAGTAAGASIDIGNGFTAAVGYTGDGTTEGLATKQGLDVFGGQLTYTGDSYGASVTYALKETSTTAETTYWGLNGYWIPEETGTAVPSISVGYEVGDPSGSTNDTEQWFVGLQWDEVGPGTLGAAVGTNGAITEGNTDYYAYEAFYSYPVNDGMTVTPLIFVKEASTDSTGIMVKTSFSF